MSEEYTPAAISREIHGENGVGEIALERSERMPEKESGVDFLICAVREHKNELTIMAAGPSLALSVPMYLTAETEGPLRGRTVGRQEMLREPGGNTAVCLNVDAKGYLEGFMEAMRQTACGR